MRSARLAFSKVGLSLPSSMSHTQGSHWLGRRNSGLSAMAAKKPSSVNFVSASVPPTRTLSSLLFRMSRAPVITEFADDEQDKKSQHTASQRVIITLYDMAKEGLIERSLLLTAHIRFKVVNSSSIMLDKIRRLENAFIALLRELAPDADNENLTVSLRPLNQQLLNDHHETNTDRLRLLLNSLSQDGRGLAGCKGSLTFHYRGLDHYNLRLQRSWTDLQITAERRQQVAETVLNAILARVPDNTPASADVLVQFSDEDLLAAVRSDMTLLSLKDPLAAVERALNFLHEQNIITLQQGLAVFRSAMTVQVLPEAKARRYNKSDYEPLAQHYGERAFQIHVINEYAQKFFSYQHRHAGDV